MDDLAVKIRKAHIVRVHDPDGPDSCAGKVLGRQVLVRATDTQAPSSPSGSDAGSAKLDSLSKYGVTFE